MIMKKILLSLVAVVMVIAGANAQASFGVKAGANLANVGGDIEENNMKIGIHIGGVANFQLSESFAFAPELLFSTQGYKMDGADFMGISIPETKVNMTYLNIPLLAKIYLGESFNIHAGPTVGFLLAAKVKAGDESEDIKDGMKGLDFGLGFGLGYELESGLNFGARYNLGLANIADTEEGDDSKITNQVIQISVGFNF